MSTITARITNMTELIAPSRQEPSTFEDRADILLNEFPNFGTELNTISTQMNTVSGEVNTNAGIATTQAGLATTNGASQVLLAEAQVALAAEQVALAAEQAGLATTNGEAQVLLAIAARDEVVDYVNDAESYKNAVSLDRDYVAEAKAEIQAVREVGLGLGMTSDGVLFLNVAETSNVTNIEINSAGELIVTY